MPRTREFSILFRKEVHVIVGALNWPDTLDEWLVAKAVHQHSRYNDSFDAEIIEIPPVDASKYPPICLAANFTETPEEPAFVIGYGGHLNESHENYGVLYEDYTYLRGPGDCSSLPDRQICAGGHRVADMDGDSGGPLMNYRRGRWCEVGVLSTYQQVDPKHPPPDDGQWHFGNRFTRVSAMCDWIEEVTEGEAKCRDIA
ncbi:chymotrypsinogen B-like protein [Aphelenchoides avenae]|nr:chymotrypsinogen B-like protein [Aphelenchus avenae]